MGLLSSKEKKLFEFIESLHTADSLAHLHQTLIEGMGSLVQGESFDLAFFGEDTAQEDGFIASSAAFTAEEIAFQLAHALEHPLARCFARGLSGAHHISQFASDHEWQNTSVFVEGGYRRLGLHRELAIDIQGLRQPMMATFSIIRSRRDFSAQDREMLNLLRPHITRAWHQRRRQSRGHSPATLRLLYPTLSIREAEILSWIIEGKQNAEIALILDRRLATIQEHVENIIHKLDMENRHQMTVAVLRAVWA